MYAAGWITFALQVHAIPHPSALTGCHLPPGGRFSSHETARQTVIYRGYCIIFAITPVLSFFHSSISTAVMPITAVRVQREAAQLAAEASPPQFSTNTGVSTDGGANTSTART